MLWAQGTLLLAAGGSLICTTRCRGGGSSPPSVGWTGACAKRHAADEAKGGEPIVHTHLYSPHPFWFLMLLTSIRAEVINTHRARSPSHTPDPIFARLGLLGRVLWLSCSRPKHTSFHFPPAFHPSVYFPELPFPPPPLPSLLRPLHSDDFVGLVPREHGSAALSLF